MSEAGHLRGESLARLVHLEQLGHGVAQRLGAVVRAAKRDLRHRVAQHARGDRVTLGVVGVEQAVRRRPLDHLRQLPSEVHRVLHADVEALAAHRGMHVRGVAGEQDAPVAIGRGLPGHVGEPRDPGGAVDPEVGAVDGDERLAEIAQRGLGGGCRICSLGQHDPARGPPFSDSADGVDADGVAAEPPRRLLGHLDLGDQPAHRRIPPGELDAGRLADHAASAVAPDEVLRAQRLAVGQRDVDAGVVLREARHLTSAIDRHRQLADPVGQDALDVVLPQREPVVVARGEVADVERDHGEARDLHRPVPARGTDRRCRADRGPRSCARAGRPRASRRAPGWRAARRSRRRRPPAPARPPASAPSDRLRRSPPHARS